MIEGQPCSAAYRTTPPTSNSASAAAHPSAPYAKLLFRRWSAQKPSAFWEFQVVDEEMGFVRHNCTSRASQEAACVSRTTNSANRMERPVKREVGIC